MNTYQLTIHLSPQLTKEKSEKLQSEIIDEIEKNKGKLIQENSLDKVRLDYTILDFNQAILWDIDIKFPPKNIQELKNFLADQSNVLRAMVVKKKELSSQRKKPKAKPKKKKKAEKTKTDKKEKSEKKESKKEKEKVELNNIDDKLDQILEEDL